MSKADPNPIDIGVGARVRALRAARGYTQVQLGEAIGVSFQQVQKYERGTNRVSASKLYAVAHFLEVTVADLMGEGAGAISVDSASALGTSGANELLQQWSRLSPQRRRLVLDLVRQFAADDGDRSVDDQAA